MFERPGDDGGTRASRSVGCVLARTDDGGACRWCVQARTLPAALKPGDDRANAAGAASASDIGTEGGFEFGQRQIVGEMGAEQAGVVGGAL